MSAGSYYTAQELQPLDCTREFRDLPDLSPTLKTISQPDSRKRPLHLFQCQGSVLTKYEENEREDEYDYVEHQIRPDDTLEGLAIQYNVSKTVLKTLNSLVTDEIFYLKHLRVPQKSNTTHQDQKRLCNKD